MVFIARRMFCRPPPPPPPGARAPWVRSLLLAVLIGASARWTVSSPRRPRPLSTHGPFRRPRVAGVEYLPLFRAL